MAYAQRASPDYRDPGKGDIMSMKFISKTGAERTAYDLTGRATERVESSRDLVSRTLTRAKTTLDAAAASFAPQQRRGRRRRQSPAQIADTYDFDNRGVEQIYEDIAQYDGN